MHGPPDRNRRSPVPVTAAAVAPRPEGPAELRELTAAGLRCRTESPWRELTRVRLALRVPQGPATTPTFEQIEVEGVVVGCEPLPGAESRFDVVLMFDRLGPRGRERLVARVAPALHEGALTGAGR